MMTTDDTNNILFSLLNGSPVHVAMTGGVYTGEDRPDDSTKEDIVVNTITVTQDCHPQEGVSNVNIYVPDLKKNIGGNQQLKADTKRLDELTRLAIDVLRNARIEGVGLIVRSQARLSEESIKQHFTNIRIEWVLE